MLLGRQVNTLFCLIAAKRKKRETETREKEEGDEKNVGKKRRLQTLGELWLQAFVSNLKTKSSGNIKTSFKNNMNIFCGALYGTVLP